MECKGLEMLNVGHNDLGNEFLFEMKESLLANRTLLRLGIQATRISSQGAIALAEIIADNPTLQVLLHSHLLENNFSSNINIYCLRIQIKDSLRFNRTTKTLYCQSNLILVVF
jgi:protein phosphatase 1 regulatory subunit 37